MTRAADVVVVGGGLAGLAAATLCARGGRTVTLFERSAALGGRAATHVNAGFAWNLGPHALYRGGAAAEVLRALGVSYSGKVPAASGSLALDGGALHTLPVGLVSLISTGLYGVGAKLETARLMGKIPHLATDELATVPLSRWLDERVRDARLRRLFEALIRVATYTNDPARISAGLALRQVQIAVTEGVLYLDGGWQTLADGLAAAATEAGVKIVTGVAVAAIDHDQAVRAVRLADGSTISAPQVILAGTPSLASHLVPNSAPLFAAARAALPVEAACLDLALARLPRPRNLLAIGLDQPLYFSVHSATARLTDGDGAVIHVAKYLRPGAPADPDRDRAELEALCDLVQPGWRDALVGNRFLPRMAVYHHLPTASDGGLAGRPLPSVAQIDGLYIAGDWVGPCGHLADAALASARSCAELILAPRAGHADGSPAVEHHEEARAIATARA